MVRISQENYQLTSGEMNLGTIHELSPTVLDYAYGDANE